MTVTVWSWVQGQVVWYRNEDKVVMDLVEEDYSNMVVGSLRPGDTILLQPVLSWTSSFVVPMALVSRLACTNYHSGNVWGNYPGGHSGVCIRNLCWKLLQLTPLVHVLFRSAVRVFLQFVVMFGRQHGFGEGLHGEHEKDENALLMELDKGHLFRYSNVMSHFWHLQNPDPPSLTISVIIFR